VGCIFFVKNFYAEFHENATGGSVADPRSQPDGRTVLHKVRSVTTPADFWHGQQIVCLSVVQNAQTDSTAHPPFLAMVTGSFQGIRQSRREVNHSCPCSAKTKNVWSHTSTPPTCLHGVDRENITFTFTPYKDCRLILEFNCVVTLGRV